MPALGRAGAGEDEAVGLEAGAWKPPLLEKSGSPLASSFSPYWARIVVPAGPAAANSTQPASTRGNLTT